MSKLFFKPKKENSGIVFIVEDNKVYGSTLQAYIQNQFPHLKEVKLFPVGETCIMDLKRNPDLIILDYSLDSKYEDAENGLEIVKQIREIKPEQQIVVLSAQDEVTVTVELIKNYHCNYIVKNAEAFEKVKELLQELELAT